MPASGKPRAGSQPPQKVRRVQSVEVHSIPAVPKKQDASSSSSSSAPAISAPASATQQWACPRCTYLNDESLSACTMCDLPRPARGEWSCPRCTMQNQMGESVCGACALEGPQVQVAKEQSSKRFLDAQMRQRELERQLLKRTPDGKPKPSQRVKVAKGTVGATLQEAQKSHGTDDDMTLKEFEQKRKSDDRQAKEAKVEEEKKNRKEEKHKKKQPQKDELKKGEPQIGERHDKKAEKKRKSDMQKREELRMEEVLQQQQSLVRKKAEADKEIVVVEKTTVEEKKRSAEAAAQTLEKQNKRAVDFETKLRCDLQRCDSPQAREKMLAKIKALMAAKKDYLKKSTGMNDERIQHLMQSLETEFMPKAIPQQSGAPPLNPLLAAAKAHDVTRPQEVEPSSSALPTQKQAAEALEEAARIEEEAKAKAAAEATEAATKAAAEAKAEEEANAAALAKVAEDAATAEAFAKAEAEAKATKAEEGKAVEVPKVEETEVEPATKAVRMRLPPRPSQRSDHGVRAHTAEVEKTPSGASRMRLEVPKVEKTPSGIIRMRPRPSQRSHHGVRAHTAEATIVYLPTTKDGLSLLEHAGPGLWKVVTEDGVAYRKTKQLGDQVTGGRGVDHGEVIGGVDEEDGWIRCSMKAERKLTVNFSPGILGWRIVNGTVMALIRGQAQKQGVKVGMRMTRIGGQQFSDELLQAKISGTEDYEVEFIEATTVYLPTTKDGQSLLEHAGPGLWKVVTEDGVAYRKTKQLGDQVTGGRGVDHGEVIQGVDEEDGWIRCSMKVDDGLGASDDKPTAKKASSIKPVYPSSTKPCAKKASSIKPVYPSSAKPCPKMASVIKPVHPKSAAGGILAGRIKSQEPRMAGAYPATALSTEDTAAPNTSRSITTLSGDMMRRKEMIQEGRRKKEEERLVNQKMFQAGRMKGYIIDLAGTYGWIVPQQKIPHPEADRLNNSPNPKLYFHKSDIRVGTTLAEGFEVTFLLYKDDRGLGATDISIGGEGDDEATTAQEEEAAVVEGAEQLSEATADIVARSSSAEAPQDSPTVSNDPSKQTDAPSKKDGPPPAPPMPDLHTPAEEANPEFEITVTRAADEKLGMDVITWNDGETLEIIKLTDGIISSWNANNPWQQIQEGDRIIEVNGARGDAQKVVDSVRMAGTLKMRLIREDKAPTQANFDPANGKGLSNGKVPKSSDPDRLKKLRRLEEAEAEAEEEEKKRQEAERKAAEEAVAAEAAAAAKRERPQVHDSAMGLLQRMCGVVQEKLCGSTNLSQEEPERRQEEQQRQEVERKAAEEAVAAEAAAAAERERLQVERKAVEFISVAAEAAAAEERERLQATFEVVVKKGSGDRLGVSIDTTDTTDKKTIVIDYIKDGLISQWNVSNPSQRIQRGDRIIAINGCEHDAKAMMNLVSHGGTLRMTLMRAKASLESRVCSKLRAELIAGNTVAKPSTGKPEVDEAGVKEHLKAEEMKLKVQAISEKAKHAAEAKLQQKKIQLEAEKKAIQKQSEVKQLSMKEKQTIMKARLAQIAAEKKAKTLEQEKRIKAVSCVRRVMLKFKFAASDKHEELKKELEEAIAAYFHDCGPQKEILVTEMERGGLATRQQIDQIMKMTARGNSDEGKKQARMPSARLPATLVHKSVTTIENALRRFRATTHEKFDADRRELDEVIAEKLPNCGEQKERLERSIEQTVIETRTRLDQRAKMNEQGSNEASQAADANTNAPRDEPQQHPEEMEDMKPCPSCAELNRPDETICVACGLELAQEANHWTCTSCDEVNKGWRPRCHNCHQKKPTEQQAESEREDVEAKEKRGAADAKAEDGSGNLKTTDQTQAAHRESAAERWPKTEPKVEGTPAFPAERWPQTESKVKGIPPCPAGRWPETEPKVGGTPAFPAERWPQTGPNVKGTTPKSQVHVPPPAKAPAKNPGTVPVEWAHSWAWQNVVPPPPPPPPPPAKAKPFLAYSAPPPVKNPKATAQRRFVVDFDALPVTVSPGRNSLEVAKLPAGTHVEVLEHMAKDLDGGRVRARIASPAGWISIKMADDSCHFVSEATFLKIAVHAGKNQILVACALPQWQPGDMLKIGSCTPSETRMIENIDTSNQLFDSITLRSPLQYAHPTGAAVHKVHSQAAGVVAPHQSAASQAMRILEEHRKALAKWSQPVEPQKSASSTSNAEDEEAEAEKRRVAEADELGRKLAQVAEDLRRREDEAERERVRRKDEEERQREKELEKQRALDIEQQRKLEEEAQRERPRCEDNIARIRELIRGVYSRCNVAKLDEVDSILEKYMGAEYEVYRKVCEKYGEEPEEEFVQKRENDDQQPQEATAKEEFVQKLENDGQQPQEATAKEEREEVEPKTAGAKRLLVRRPKAKAAKGPAPTQEAYEKVTLERDEGKTDVREKGELEVSTEVPADKEMDVAKGVPEANPQIVTPGNATRLKAEKDAHPEKSGKEAVGGSEIAHVEQPLDVPEIQTEDAVQPFHNEEEPEPQVDGSFEERLSRLEEPGGAEVEVSFEERLSRLEERMALLAAEEESSVADGQLVVHDAETLQEARAASRSVSPISPSPASRSTSAARSHSIAVPAKALSSDSRASAKETRIACRTPEDMSNALDILEATADSRETRTASHIPDDMTTALDILEAAAAAQDDRIACFSADAEPPASEARRRVVLRPHRGRSRSPRSQHRKRKPVKLSRRERRSPSRKLSRRRSRSRRKLSRRRSRSQRSNSATKKLKVVNLERLKFTHNNISPQFALGETFEDLIQDLRVGKADPMTTGTLTLECIHVEATNTFHSLFNRRLYCLKEYQRRYLDGKNLKIRVRIKGTFDTAHNLEKFLRSSTTETGGESVELRASHRYRPPRHAGRGGAAAARRWLGR